MQAMEGKIFWNLFHRIFPADKYVFFPETTGEIYDEAQKLLPEYIKKFQNRKMIIIAADKLDCSNIKVKKISKHCMNCCMKYYALKDMSDKWTVVSVKSPYDTGAIRMLGIKNMTWKEIIYYDVFRLDEDRLNA